MKRYRGSGHPDMESGSRGSIISIGYLIVVTAVDLLSPG